MKNKILVIIVAIVCFVVYLGSSFYFKNRVRVNQKTQDTTLSMKDVSSPFATSSIPTDLKNELITRAKNQIIEKRGGNSLEDILVTSSFIRRGTGGGVPELVIGSWKKKDVWDWFAYSDKGIWKIFVSFDGYNCSQIKSLPLDVQLFVKKNLTSVQMCDN